MVLHTILLWPRLRFNLRHVDRTVTLCPDVQDACQEVIGLLFDGYLSSSLLLFFQTYILFLPNTH